MEPQSIDTPQLDQTPPPQSPAPDKRQINIWMIVSIILIVILISAVVFFYINSKKSAQPASAPVLSPTAAVTSSPTTTASPSATIDEVITKPLGNTLYLGTSNTTDGVFLKDANSDYMGYFQTVTTGNTAFDFRTLLNPRKIYTPTRTIDSLNSFRMDSQKNVLYAGVLFKINTNDPYPNLDSTIIQVVLNPLSAKEVWTNKIGSNTYDGAQGAGYVGETVDSGYVVVTVANCYACEGSVVGSIILNTGTSKEKYFKGIGNIQFQIPQNTFTYQKNAPFEEPCSPGPGCNNGKRTVMKPAGQTITETLP